MVNVTNRDITFENLFNRVDCTCFVIYMHKGGKDTALGVFPYKIKSLMMDQIWSIIIFIFTLITIKHNLFIIMPQMIRIIVMSLTLAVIPKELIDVLVFRSAFRGRSAKSPFAEDRRLIAIVLQHLKYGISLRWQRMLSFHWQLFITSYKSMSRMLSCYQTASRRSAN